MQVIFATFQPLIRPGQLLPSELAPKLLHRFSSGNGYCLMGDDLPTLIGTIKSRGTRQLFDRVVVGVITNSDDRVPTILSSLGMNVSPLRYGSPDISLAADARSRNHIDFNCMSYDVGIEKPDRLIFDAAESMASEILHAGNGLEDEHTAATKTTPPLLKIFVGDEFEKDVLGALGAGWHAVQLHDGHDDGHITHTHLNNYLKGSFRETFPESIQSPVSLSTDSLSSFLKWLNEY
jgi:ribonucleotide monophosphatase NagD (HAD superfamily)